MKDLKILNKFGILPTKNCRAAGYDFFVPNIVDPSEEDTTMILQAFSDSYGKSLEELVALANRLSLQMSACGYEVQAETQQLNVLHLYLSLTSYSLLELEDEDEQIEYFVDNYLTFDSNSVAGLVLETNDHIKANTGLKMKFEDGYALVFDNKSGRGTKGFDVRAKVVDEDYAGFVHLSFAYTGEHWTNGTFYCGDKMLQGLFLKVESPAVVEINDEEFAEAHSASERGGAGFGSSDVKH